MLTSEENQPVKKSSAPPSKATRRILRLWSRKSVRIAVYSLIGLFLLVFDFFGFDTATERYSEVAFYNIVSPNYGARLQPPRNIDTNSWDIPTWQSSDPGARIDWNQRISVILLDDDALRDNDRSGVWPPHGISWPAPLEYHVRLLTRLYDWYRPSAIMVDFFFMDRRPGDEEALKKFVALVERIKTDGVTRLYLASHDEKERQTEDDRCSDIQNIVPPLSDVARLATASWPEEDGAKPLFYPLANGAGYRIKCDENGKSPGAAFTMFRDLCEDFSFDTAARSVYAKMNCHSLSDGAEAFSTPMQVVWGSVAPDMNWAQGPLNIFCDGQSVSLFRRTVEFFYANTFGRKSSVHQTCPYQQVVKARDFMNARFHSPSRNPEAVKAFRSAFSARDGDLPKIVFYGASFIGARDDVDTPTHGPVPGVFLHAMALDNLLTLGRGYIHEADDFDWKILLIDALIAVLVATVAVFGRDISHRAKLDGASTLRTTRIFIVTFLTGATVILIAMYATFTWGRMAPINWIGFMGVLSTIMLIRDQWLENLARSIIRHIRDIFRAHPA